MSYFEKFCAECGSRLEGAKICPKCGVEVPEETPTSVEEASSSAKKKVAQKSGDGSTWDSLEDIISIGGWLSWFLLMLAAIGMIIQIFTNFGKGYIFWGIWYTLSTLFTVYTIITYGKVYSDKCKAKDWEFLMTDMLIIGTLEIPKMLAFAVLLFIFTQFWGGFLVYASAFLIYFFYPKK